jgi:SAM-dependent methyltransferase
MDTKIKIDLKKVFSSELPVIVELGCGTKEKKGRICVDKIDLPNVDIVTDLENGLGFLPDNSVDEIYCKSMLEHIDNFENLMREIVRVLKTGGRAHIFVPHFSNPYYHSDYTHKRFFGLYSFYYFVEPGFQLKRKVPVFYTSTRIRILSLKLVFMSPFLVSKHIKKVFEWLINSHRILMEWYEQHFCYIVPCYGIEIVFAPVK